MYDSLVKADNPRIEQLVRIGHSEGEAILIIFQEKCARRQPMRDTTHTRQSFPPREQPRPQTQPVRAQQVGSAVSVHIYIPAYIRNILISSISCTRR